MSQSLLSQARARLNRFFVVYEGPWELFMVALAIVFVVLGFLPDLEHWSPETRETINAVDWGLTGFFLWEFVTRFSLAPSRKAYLAAHWIDIVALLPMVRFLRFLRVLRVLRLLRIHALSRYFHGFDRFTTHFKGITTLHNLHWMLIGMGAILFFAARFFEEVEKGINAQVHGFGDAFWWAIVTVATVGYGDVAPVTGMGRIVAGFLMFAGVGMWSLVTANIAAYFLAARRRANVDVDPVIEELKGKLERLDSMTEMEVVALRGSLDAILTEKQRQAARRPGKDAPGFSGQSGNGKV